VLVAHKPGEPLAASLLPFLQGAVPGTRPRGSETPARSERPATDGASPL
jgi:hypothetical protein